MKVHNKRTTIQITPPKTLLSLSPLQSLLCKEEREEKQNNDKKM